MASNAGTLEALARHLAQALVPLKEELAPAKALQRLAEAGLALPPAVLANPGFNAALSNASNAAGALGPLIPQLAAHIQNGNEAGILSIGAQVIAALGASFNALDALAPALKAAGPVPGIPAGEFNAFADALPARMLGKRVIAYLEDLQPSIVGIANLLGIVDRLPQRGAANDPLRPPFVLEQIHLSKLADVLQSPATAFKSLFGWGDPGFDGAQLMPRLAVSLGNLGLPALLDSTGKSIEAGSFKVKVLPGAPPGISATLSAPIMSGFDVTLPLTPTWSARVRAQGIFAAGLEMNLAPPSTLTLKPNPPGPQLNGELNLDFLARSPTKDRPLVLFGQTGGSRLQADGISFGVGIAPKWDAGAGHANAPPSLRFEITKGRAVIDLPDDSFLNFLTGGLNGETEFSLSGTWSPASGVQFDGAAGIEIALPAHTAIGPAKLKTLYLRAGIEGGAFPVELSAAISANLGPIDVSIDRIGVIARLSFPASGGNLGPVNLSFEPRLPTGMGLSIDVGGFKGGGFLRFDPPKGEYGGVIELDFLGILTVKAVAVLNTKMPSGRDGFSLVIIITAEFIPIQLGFGFTLIGVGGLLGLNRTVFLEALRAGVYDGSLNSILFPADAINNAPRIINDVSRIFPPLEDRFLIGPMAKLGWGTPTILSLELGIILEIPRPMFAILGVLRASLPAEDAPLIKIQVNFLGVVDFDKGQLSFDASIYDSYILMLTLTGDMALRLYWGENSNFLLTVGGFHPAYTPPPMDLPPLKRLAIEVFPGMPHIRAEAYFAITSNTVQTGARVELYAGADIFNVYGFMGFDALLQLSPLHFIAELAAMLAVRSGDTEIMSIQVEALLEGPSPWHARGKGSFRIGFIIKISISVGFDITIGEDRASTLPPIEALPELRKALEKAGNWRAALPRGAHLGVSLRERPPEDDSLILHPFGSLEITQKLLPLNLPLDRFGAQPLANGRRFSISKVEFGADVAATQSTREQFAPAQFLDMNDAEKLSRKSFERYDGGVQVGGGDAPKADHCVGLDVVYEVTYLPEQRKGPWFSLTKVFFDALALGNAAARSSGSFQKRSPSGLGTPKVAMTTEKFAVASTSDLKLHASDLVFDSEAEAHAAMRATVSGKPEFAHELQVVPLYQVNAA